MAAEPYGADLDNVRSPIASASIMGALVCVVHANRVRAVCVLDISSTVSLLSEDLVLKHGFACSGWELAWSGS